MKRATTLFFAIAALIAAGTASQAQAKPNFSGEWKIDAAKSSFGQMPAPTTFVRKVDHKDPKLTVTTTQAGEMGEYTSTSNYVTDGSETTNEIRGTQAKSTAVWDGDALTITLKLEFNGNPVVVSETWTLSEDGKVLTSKLHFSSPQGEGDATVVLAKQ